MRNSFELDHIVSLRDFYFFLKGFILQFKGNDHVLEVKIICSNLLVSLDSFL